MKYLLTFLWAIVYFLVSLVMLWVCFSQLLRETDVFKWEYNVRAVVAMLAWFAFCGSAYAGAKVVNDRY